MLTDSALTQALKTVKPMPYEGTLFRVINAKHMHSGLSAIGSTAFGGRYNPRNSFEALYLSESLPTALAEVLGYSITDPSLEKMKGPPRLILSINCSLECIIDLTNEENLTVVDTTISGLLLDWREGHLVHGLISETQRLGRAAFESEKIQALRVPSARDEKVSNLVVFPSKLTNTESILEIHDPFGQMSSKLP